MARALLKLLQQIFFKNEATLLEKSLTRETKEDTFNREMRISDKEADKENMSVPCLLSAPHSLLM
ncbi:8569_t:CDS:2 [Rhizophagus irregularis]|nr:8569_t:CDS:2 [Rhizophagus irregularis]